jgi:hypothetical protein
MGQLLFAQTTINNDENSPKSPAVKNETKHKILLIPFDNKLYMSEIDHVINAETKQNQNEIRWSFKDGVDNALSKKLKSKYDVVSLIEDTTKNKKELQMIYSGVGYKYDKVPPQTNYKAPKSDDKKGTPIKNGQLETDVNTDARFMNAKINNKDLLASLNKKFKTDVFIFINELDLKASPQGAEDFGSVKTRTAIIHYTVFNLAGKEINSGIVNVKFPKSQNDPAKISSSYLSKAMEEIAQRVERSLQPASNITGQ